MINVGDFDTTPVVTATASASERWGTGFAVAAHPLTHDTMVVVTSAGIYLVDGTERAPLEIEAFSAPVTVGTSAVSPDTTLLVVALDSPAELRWYDLNDGRTVATTGLAVGETVRQLRFLPSSDTLIAATSNGVKSWRTEAPEAAPVLMLDQAVGAIGSVGGGRLAAPVLGTTDLVVFDGAAVDRRSLAVPSGAELLDAHASPGHDVLAVAVEISVDAFESTTEIHRFDGASLAPAGTTVVDRKLGPFEWAVSTDAVAVADGPALSFYSPSGDLISEQTPLPDDAIQTVSSTGNAFISVHRSGALVDWSGPDWAPTALDVTTLTLQFVDTTDNELIAVDIDGAILRLNLDNRELRDDLRFATGEATAAAISADGQRVAVATTAGRAIILDGDLQLDSTLGAAGQSARVDAVEFNPATGQLVTGLAERVGQLAFDDSVTMWDPETQSPTASIGGESEDVAGCSTYFNRVGFTPDGSLMSTVSHDFSVGMYDGRTGEFVTGIRPFASTILATDFSSTGDIFVAAADDAMVGVWQTDGFEQIASYRAAPGGLQAFALLPDGSTMIATDLTGRLFILDVMTGEELAVLADLGGRTMALGLADDGMIVAAAMNDGSVGLWSTTSGELLTSLGGHAAAVVDIEFAPDGTWLVTASRDGTVRKWDLATS